MNTSRKGKRSFYSECTRKIFKVAETKEDFKETTSKPLVWAIFEIQIE